MEEDDIKFALRNIAAANLSLCDQLISLNASPTMIAQNATGGFIVDVETVEEYVNRITAENERLKTGIEQLKKYDLDMTDNCNVYFVNSAGFVIASSPQKMLGLDSWYVGEDIVTDIEQVIPELLLPLLYDSLKAQDLGRSKRINKAITNVLASLDKQKENSNE